MSTSTSAEKEIKVGKLPLRFKPEVPPPLPWRALLIGPAILTLGLSIGSGELLFWPIMSSGIGPTLLWAGLLSLLFQTIWTLEMSRWTVWTGEHWVLQMARFMGLTSAVTLWSVWVFLTNGFGGWITTAADVANRVTGWPGGSVGIVVWAIIMFFILWLVALVADVVRKWVEWIMMFKTFIIWAVVLTVVAALTAKVPWMWADIARGIFVPQWPSGDIPVKVSYWSIASAIGFIGAGGTLNMFYTFWIRDAGYGMGKYIGTIPGYLRGKPVAIELTGYLPEPTPENIRRIRTWKRRVDGMFWLIFFILNYATIILFVSLLYGGSLLGLVKPVRGAEVVLTEANVVEFVLGPTARVLFLLVAIVLLFGTNLSVAEGTVRVIADTIFISSERVRRAFKNDIRRLYFFVMSLFVLWAVFWATWVLRGAPSILLVQLPAVLNLVFQVVSAPLTVYFIYGVARKHVPKEIWDEMKPNPIVPVILIIAAIYWAIFAALGIGEQLGLVR